MTDHTKKIVGGVTAVIVLAALAVGLFFLTRRGEDTYGEKYAGVDLSADVGDISRENTYTAYLSAHPSDQLPGQTISIDLTAAEGVGGV